MKATSNIENVQLRRTRAYVEKFVMQVQPQSKSFLVRISTGLADATRQPCAVRGKKY
jgi:hypothetical protein